MGYYLKIFLVGEGNHRYYGVVVIILRLLFRTPNSGQTYGWLIRAV